YVADGGGHEDRLQRPLLHEAPQVRRPRLDVAAREALDLHARVAREIARDVLRPARETADARLRVRARPLGGVAGGVHQSPALICCLILHGRFLPDLTPTIHPEWVR